MMSTDSAILLMLAEQRQTIAALQDEVAAIRQQPQEFELSSEAQEPAVMPTPHDPVAAGDSSCSRVECCDELALRRQIAQEMLDEAAAYERMPHGANAAAIFVEAARLVVSSLPDPERPATS